MITDFFFRPQPCLSPDSARVTFFLRSGKISSPPSCKPPSPCINNVSTSTEESLFLRPGVGYKEESRCRNQERGAEVAPFSGGLLTEIGCLFNRSAPVSAGLGWDSASHSSRISSKKQTKKKQKKKNTLPALLFHAIPSSTQRDISTSLLQGDLSRNSQARYIEMPRKRGLSAGILV